MEWTHLACLLAGTFVGVFLMTVWRNERQHRREQDAAKSMYWEAFQRGRYIPPEVK